MQLDTERVKARTAALEGDRTTRPQVDRDGRGNLPDFENFSPDPLHQTDRYRLVTPYRLPNQRSDPSER